MAINDRLGLKAMQVSRESKSDEFVSIVVPCFNEEAGIRELLARCRSAASDAVGERYEIVLVDDGSADGTWRAILNEMDAHSDVIGIRLSRNFGHQIALTAGLSAVNGTVVFVLDADLQDPPELLKPMLRHMKETDADVVYGKRKSRVGEGRFKRATASIFYRLLREATDVTIPVDTGDFRLISRRVADIIARMPERDRFIRGMVASVGFRQAPFEYDRQERFAGDSKYPLAKMISFAIDAFLGYSMILLRFASLAALAMLVVLCVVILYSLYEWLYGRVIPGWTSLMIIIATASFFQLVALSIIGEYVGRTYLATKERPLFIIDEIRRSAGERDLPGDSTSPSS
ncbi:glycosyltransferase family 2 protein [Bradyrhizobium xenonodulans]|uniref:Glycosyltransferase family 2 protein n=1 Tax=Bradyrhizobium xenonodulans TaxID=2736875 RepID=A0ABY7MPW7_9BRAD|nr:glycosyltransferase family 2 protein [Bradyrhizobium xenonodulans]WBL80435.1 glycosyltransferase family 2 protein [Bradyrhizobium xenonodulans]